MTLNQKTLLITGGAGALGRAVAAHAAQLGARVVLFDRAFGDDLAARYTCRVVNLAVAADVAAAVAAIEADLGGIDALCNVAGGFDMGRRVADADDTQWHAMFEMNVTTVRNLLKAVVPGMQARRRGSIVNVGALSALSGKPMMSAYTASKAVVMNLTSALAGEVGADGIRVNAVLPSIIDTPANRASMPDADPAGWTSPADIAKVICFLASDDSQAINGVLLPVTGTQGKG